MHNNITRLRFISLLTNAIIKGVTVVEILLLYNDYGVRYKLYVKF